MVSYCAATKKAWHSFGQGATDGQNPIGALAFGANRHLHRERLLFNPHLFRLVFLTRS